MTPIKRRPAPPSAPRTLLAGLILSAATLLAAAPAAPAAAQVSLDRPLRVFLDCNGFFCDLDYFTEEVPWVNFVRDRQDADVHVLGTRQSTGGGGGSYVLQFRGQAAFDGQQFTLSHTTVSDATEDMERQALAGAVQQGLAPFAATTPSAPRVEVLPPAPPEDGDELSPEDDPWDRWSFRVSMNGFMNGESQQRFLTTNGNASATRVTADWKIQAFLSGSQNTSVFELPDGTQRFEQRSYSGRLLTARSVGSHWALGGLVGWRQSTFANFRHSARVAPAIEYNVFPYGESNRRLLTVLWTLGAGYNVYDEVTIFNETEEALIEQRLIVAYDVTQPWGTVDVALRGNHYLAKFGEGDAWPDPQYNASLSGNLRVRLFRGFSFNVGGNLEMVRSQLQLTAADLTEGEILTRQRELATNYRYFMHFGVQYQFGSIFTNVVNPRFDRFF